MIELIIACVVAVSTSSSMFIKKSIRKAGEVVLEKNVSVNTSIQTLGDFLSIHENYTISRQYHYEAGAIKLLFRLTVFLSLCVIIGSLIIIFSFDLSANNLAFPEGLYKTFAAFVVLSLLSTFACFFLAGGIKPDEN